MPSRLVRAALASLLVAPAAELAPRASAAEEVAESIVGVVDSMPVLLSETRLVAQLKGLDLIRAREALVDELLMHREAARLPQASVSPGEVRGIVEALTAVHPGLVEEAGEQGIARLARRQACILRYVEFRFRPQIRIADETLRREWQTTNGTATEAPTAEGYAELRSQLERKELDARVEAWVAELRRQARLRYNPMPEPKP
jgi:hypothetical protein